MYIRQLEKRNGFTLIELLIVVAIIGILAAIAIPNFLEAQTRAKVARSKADMRSILTAFEMYRIDHTAMPPPMNPAEMWLGPGNLSWWGFTPINLTTPIAYISSIPRMPFFDTAVLAVWQIAFGGSQDNQPYTYVWDVSLVRRPSGATYITIPGGYNSIDSFSYAQKVESCSYFVYTCGADYFDGTVNGAPVEYDPTNGTISFGDVYGFGTGRADDTTDYQAHKKQG